MIQYRINKEALGVEHGKSNALGILDAELESLYSSAIELMQAQRKYKKAASYVDSCAILKDPLKGN